MQIHLISTSGRHDRDNVHDATMTSNPLTCCPALHNWRHPIPVSMATVEQRRFEITMGGADRQRYSNLSDYLLKYQLLFLMHSAFCVLLFLPKIIPKTSVWMSTLYSAIIIPGDIIIILWRYYESFFFHLIFLIMNAPIKEPHHERGRPWHSKLSSTHCN